MRLPCLRTVVDGCQDFHLLRGRENQSIRACVVVIYLVACICSFPISLAVAVVLSGGMADAMCSGCAICVELQCPQGVSFKAAWLAQFANVIPPLAFH